MQELEQAVHTIQVRFGSQALARARDVPAVHPWPTGCAAVDRLSGIGGLPKGRLSLLQGRGTCGKTSLGLAFLNRASHEFAQAVVLDPGLVFDPWALLPLQPQIESLAVVRPPDPAATGEAAIALAKAGTGFLLLLLSTRAANEAEPWLSQLCAAAERSGCILVTVAEAAPLPLAHASSLTFALEPGGWLFERGQLAGLRTRLRCLKNKVAAPGAETELEIRYPFGATIFPKQPVQAADVEEVPSWTAASAAV